MKKMLDTVVFFGSGPVASESLKRLAQDFEIEAVITKPRPSHHKASFPVLETARELGLKTLTANNKVELTSLFEGQPFKSRVGLVIDYGILIDRSVIDYFPLGIVNSHFSLLPSLRGADPISFAILEGRSETGVSLMLINEALDEGPLLNASSLKLTPEATTPSLTSDLITLSHELLRDHLPAYLAGQLQPYPQSSSGVSYTRKLTKADGELNWQKPAVQLEREIRAFIEWPRSRTAINGIDLIVTKAHVTSGRGQPGRLWRDDKELGIYTAKDIFVIDRLLPIGKKEMPTSAFLAGYQL